MSDSPKFSHETVERKVSWLGIWIVIVIAVGGLVEIVPLYASSEITTPAPGVKPYPALALEGRDIYIREGCYNCHSQMIRTLRDEVERYGHYSLAAESMYDRPFQWGSKRTGPDLARVGGKYSDDWHRDHLKAPKSVVPGTVMPAYPWLAQTDLDLAHIDDDLRVQATLGVPYTAEMIANAQADAKAQAGADASADLVKRYPKAAARDYDGRPERITEADALIAYLQMLGTLVDFRLYDDKANMR